MAFAGATSIAAANKANSPVANRRGIVSPQSPCAQPSRAGGADKDIGRCGKVRHQGASGELNLRAVSRIQAR